MRYNFLNFTFLQSIELIRIFTWCIFFGWIFFCHDGLMWRSASWIHLFQLGGSFVILTRCFGVSFVKIIVVWIILIWLFFILINLLLSCWLNLIFLLFLFRRFLNLWRRRRRYRRRIIIIFAIFFIFFILIFVFFFLFFFFIVWEIIFIFVLVVIVISDVEGFTLWTLFF